ncbi:MAG: hypothetical protein FJW32_14435 [Acidobacteria bacterium]|nr:hypothetical protein [Acidobacteriota bacterium]
MTFNGAHLPQPTTLTFNGTASEWIASNLQLTPDQLQAEALDATEDRVLLLCTRQWGKSTIAAAKALHHALTTKNAFIIFAIACKHHWKIVKATADDCPRISVKFLARERVSMGQTVFSREYLCEFVAGHQQLVSQEDADAIFDTDF